MSKIGRIEINVTFDGVNVFTTNSAMEAFFYSQMRSFNLLKHEDAIKAVDVAMEIYIKDDNPTPTGHLSDYVGKHFSRLSKMSSKWDMINDFYDNYESEDYKTVNKYRKKKEN